MNFIDKAIKAISPERALKREVAKKRLSMINSGYGNYGASATKKSLIGWTHGGGSHREDVEDNIDPLRQRSRDLFYGGSNVATGAIKRLRTNTIGIGLLVICQDLVQVKMSFSHSNLPAIPKLPVDTILQNHRVTYNRNDYEFVWYYKTFPSIQIPGGMHVCNC